VIKLKENGNWRIAKPLILLKNLDNILKDLGQESSGSFLIFDSIFKDLDQDP